MRQSPDRDGQTESQETDQRLAKKVRELDVLYQVSTRLQKLNPIENLQQEIIEIVRENLGYQFGAVLLVEPDSGTLVPYAVIGWMFEGGDLEFDEEFLLSRNLKVGRGITGWVAETGQSANVADVREDPRYFGIPSNIRSEICVPLKVDDHVIGIINLENTEPDSYSQGDLEFLEAVANQVAIAIENNRLHERIRHHTEKLEHHVDERTAELLSANEQLKEEIEDRRRTEQELVHSLSLLRTTLESTADGILVLDKTGKKIITYNQNFLEMWTITQELINTGDYDLVLESVLDQVKDPQGFLASIRASHEDTDKSDYELIEFHDGRLFESYSYPQRIEGEIIGRVWSYRSMSERVKFGLMKDELISVINHELRTPLTSIHGALKLLDGGFAGELASQARELVTVALKNSDRLGLLVDDILKLEKIESGSMVFEFKAVNLSDLINQSIKINEMYAVQYGVVFCPDGPFPNVEVMADSDRLMQVMDNLLSNAAKFSPVGETVFIDMDQIGTNVRVSVTNQGCGISEEARANIFQKFYQTDTSDAREKGGTGLGLSICKSIIERLNGHIDFLSEPGGETSFFFDLPVFEEQSGSV